MTISAGEGHGIFQNSITKRLDMRHLFIRELYKDIRPDFYGQRTGGNKKRTLSFGRKFLRGIVLRNLGIDNINIEPEGLGRKGMKWIQYQSFVSMVINLGVP